MRMPATTQSSANSNEPPMRIALTRKLVPIDLEPSRDHFRALRGMLEQALLTARNAERLVRTQRIEIERLQRLSITDEHTGLLNRRGFADVLNRAIARGERYGETAVLLLIDLDGFKAINDTFGHPAGDFVLEIVADTLRKSTRKVDDAARLGGDEFAVILNNVPASLADRQAAAIEDHLNGLTVPWKCDTIRVHASVGRHCFGPRERENAQSIYDSADNDMYLRKRLGQRALETTAE